ncbi:Glucan 1-3-beta-glucosidase [Penicillium macrosclerotiorum]|uniref:Glucan 1-3-beta-glucosidase n=1 Tax=Penicillium macrosclerotiorum TaxID=303699 RepID=UPI0025482F3D|nr:Glucan 1-3-beta-glucosidase [Penicillium macrosclerotiorum]KAJ5682203.1 Glucan 1-3-beta-glucosidase [Penicillium macrosclerotiorum]
MRVSTLLPFILAAAPAVVSARGTLGFSLGDKNADGTCKSTSDYEADFDDLKDLATLVRTYSGTECDTPQNILPAAKNKGFKVVLGIWVGAQDKSDMSTNDASFVKDFAALKKAVPGYESQVDAITVGSETLYRGDLTGPQLHNYISAVQKQFPSITVGTADSWNKFADGTADDLFTTDTDDNPMVTYVLANAFAYWQGTAADKAYKTYFDDMSGAMSHIQQVAGDNADKIRVINGETGWPTDGGSDYDAAKAGTQNAETFWKTGVCGMLAWGVDLFYFEAYDESWKPDSVGDNGQAMDEKHWGLRTAARKTKFDTTCPK